MAIRLMALIVALFVLLETSAFATLDTISSRQSLVIENVTVIPMTENRKILSNQTVVIDNGRIVSIQPATQDTDFDKAARIDGRGKWLIPGLSDMHVHIGNDRLLRLLNNSPTPVDGEAILQDLFMPYIANGVLQIFDLAAMSETIGQRIEIESGRILGPHIATAAMIDGDNAIWPVGMTRIARTPADGRQTVRDLFAEGYEYIKVYSRVDLPTFSAIVDEARKLDMRVVGHIPQRGQGITASFFQPGYDLVAHAEEFAQQTALPDKAAIPSYTEMTLRNGSALVSTLTANERILEVARNPETLSTREELHILSPQFYAFSVENNPYAAQSSDNYIDYVQQIVDFNRPLVRAFSQAGITILTGTDAGIPGVAPGFALHDEFEALAEAGLDNYAILENSTRLPAEWLGVATDRGTVQVGMRADLVLLDSDPIENISNTRQIAGVIRDGRYLSRKVLDKKMSDLIERNRAGYATAAN